jgi:hypothetical protein
MRWLGAGALVCASVCAAQVDRTVDAMNRAIERGDPGAYMLCVDARDHQLAHEQRAWINDAIERGVEDLRIEIVGEERAGSDGAAVVPIRVSWVYKGRAESSEYDARFVPFAGGSDVYVYSGRDWGVERWVESPRIRILGGVGREDLIEVLAEVTPGIVRGAQEELGRELDDVLVIKVYDTVDEIRHSISPAYTDPLSGWNEPDESIKILGRDGTTPDRVSALVAHEVGHGVSFMYGESIIDAPWWSLEGIAEIVSDPYKDTGAQERQLGVARLVSRGERRDWDDLADFRGAAMNHVRFVYTQGWSMVRFVGDEFGRDARNAWFARMGEGATIDEASREVLWMGFDELDLEWTRAMREMALAHEEDRESGSADE